MRLGHLRPPDPQLNGRTPDRVVRCGECSGDYELLAALMRRHALDRSFRSAFHVKHIIGIGAPEHLPGQRPTRNEGGVTERIYWPVRHHGYQDDMLFGEPTQCRGAGPSRALPPGYAPLTW